MFVEYRVDITKQLVEGENELSILFDSAWLRGKELEGTSTIWDGLPRNTILT
jgi:beta-galactosidase/beta-glucuronidase